MVEQIISAIPITGLWTAWFFYWVISARRIKTVTRRESLRTSIVHEIPLAIGCLLMMSPWHLPPSWLYDRFLPDSPVVYWVGVIGLAAGLGFTVWARVHLADNWSGNVTLKDGHELIRTGPYRFARHPIYTGLLLATVGNAVAVGEWRGIVAFAFFGTAFLLKLRREERFLSEMFGEDYDRYRSEVGALVSVPRIPSRSKPA
jgi:protein-S-isoprenylcysteine O-methyltransferase Ste14